MPQDRPSCIGSTLLKITEARPLTAHRLEAYRGKPLAMVPICIIYVMVATVARILLGLAGP